jgi:hypothetical protein
MSPITPEIVAVAITRHFLYYEYRRPTDRNDHKCELCKQMDYPLRRRFKTAPEGLEKILMDELAKIEELKRAREPEAEHVVKGGKIYTTLEKLAEDAVHDWIKTQTRVKFGTSRTRRHHDYSYDPFTSMMLIEIRNINKEK